ncbi:MAG: sn-glycerol-3-phosphate ABC transporter permease UgpE [Pseudomonadota bacterium]
MIEHHRILDIICHLTLIGFVVICLLPVWVALVGSTHDLSSILAAPMPMLPGSFAIENYTRALNEGPQTASADLRAWRLLLNSALMATIICVGKITLSLFAAFAIVFFRFPFRKTAFWLIFLTLMLPVEIRIIPTYEVVANLNLVGTYTGLTLPLMASATAVFLFRQFFMTIPANLIDAARMDGASPMAFFFWILLPLSRTNIAALAIIMFLFGWNQYLWPLLVADDLDTIVLSLKRMMDVGDAEADWPVIMATSILSLLPPVLILIFLQRWFVRGLIDIDK